MAINGVSQNAFSSVNSNYERMIISRAKMDLNNALSKLGRNPVGIQIDNNGKIVNRSELINIINSPDIEKTRAIKELMKYLLPDSEGTLNPTRTINIENENTQGIDKARKELSIYAYSGHPNDVVKLQLPDGNYYIVDHDNFTDLQYPLSALEVSLETPLYSKLSYAEIKTRSPEEILRILSNRSDWKELLGRLMKDNKDAAMECLARMSFQSKIEYTSWASANNG